ncbi:TonB-dependent receptor family protein [Pseudomonas typographi]|uniref:TonB-dependent receptor family protein n=1 Tax=Pseudomonas typographi TaxID=2715964 RepID=UPI00308408BF
MSRYNTHTGRTIYNFKERPLRCAVSAGILLLACGNVAQAESTETDSDQRLDTVVVEGQKEGAEQAARNALKEVPGGTSLVSLDDVGKGRVSTSEDIFAYQPGVYAQSVGGSDLMKINIRGSSVNRGADGFRDGVLYLFDGLPVTGPGGTPYELFEPLGLNYTEIFRGANSFDLGSVALGGAVNYVTHTGHDSAPFQVRYEAGSYGYRKRQVSSGQTIGAFDYYVSLTDSDRSGYADRTDSNTKGVAANFGYVFNSQLETRFYVRYRELEQSLPGRITIYNATHHSRNPQGSYGNDGVRKHPGSTWVANKTTWHIDENQTLEVGFTYHDYPLDATYRTVRGKSHYTDISGQINYKREDTIYGRDSVTKVGWRSIKTNPDTNGDNTYAAASGRPVGSEYATMKFGGADHTLFASNELELVPKLWLITGLSALYAQRDVDLYYPVRTQNKLNTDELDFSPRIGLRYELSPSVQLYGNISRSVQPPNTWALVSTSYNTILNLKNQKAVTLEVGGRGDSWIGQWDVSVYRSQIKDELLAVANTTELGTFTDLSNGSDTIHQGLEAGLTSELWKGSNGRLSVRQAYTFNDFKYKNDPVFGSNRLPGIPKSFYQGEIRYDHPSGLYASLNTQISSKIEVDYANSLSTDGYQLFGATLGYSSPKKDWEAYLDFRNLTNKHYVAIINPGYDDAGADVGRVAAPGEGFAVYTGISYSFR